jgi:hypothetical protein
VRIKGKEGFRTPADKMRSTQVTSRVKGGKTLPRADRQSSRSQRSDIEIFCADIGSVTRNNFGWFGRLTDGVTIEGTDIAELGTAVARRINLGRYVALGFEAPMFVPLRADPLEITRCRVGETTPNWIGGPGGSVLATALAQVPWILGDLKSKISVAAKGTMDWEEFASERANLFLWEAFVSGSAKGSDHIRDAEAGVKAFVAALPNPLAANAINEPAVTSILGAALLRTGWSEEVRILHQSCLVIRAS